MFDTPKNLATLQAILSRLVLFQVLRSNPVPKFKEQHGTISEPAAFCYLTD